MDTKARLKQLLAEHMNLPDLRREDFNDDTPLFGGNLGLDSLDAVELVVLIQKYFNVQIVDMDEGRQAFASINSLAAFIKERQGREAR